MLEGANQTDLRKTNHTYDQWLEIDTPRCQWVNFQELEGMSDWQGSSERVHSQTHRSRPNC